MYSMCKIVCNLSIDFHLHHSIGTTITNTHLRHPPARLSKKERRPQAIAQGLSALPLPRGRQGTASDGSGADRGPDSGEVRVYRHPARHHASKPGAGSGCQEPFGASVGVSVAHFPGKYKILLEKVTVCVKLLVLPYHGKLSTHAFGGIYEQSFYRRQ